MPSDAASPANRDQILAQIAEPVAPALGDVERRLEDLIPEGMGGLVPVIYRHVLQAGGKRLRPLLTLLSTAAAGGDPASTANLATAVEVLHLASLIHDDVIDQATERRGRPSVPRQWGNRASILMGDFLVAEVFRRMADEFGRQALAVLAQAVAEMCQAELCEQTEDPLALTEEAYLCNIRGKTAGLIAAACEVGAMSAGDEAATLLLRQYGEALGEAFQIVDDLLDLYGDPELLGKPVLQDLGRGVWTLAVIHAVRVAPAESSGRLRDLLLAAPEDAAAAREAAELTAELGGRLYAEQFARRQVEQACLALAPLPPSSSRQSLQDLAEYVLQRQR
jgi:geranylgeranyl pyrophosphate synthase